jgi:hypothetical protein
LGLAICLGRQLQGWAYFCGWRRCAQSPPYGGYGINSGLEDVRNIGWKLAAVLEGWGDAKLLDSYDEERRWVFRSTIDDFIAKSIKSDGDFLEAYSPDRTKTSECQRQPPTALMRFVLIRPDHFIAWTSLVAQLA